MHTTKLNIDVLSTEPANSNTEHKILEKLFREIEIYKWLMPLLMSHATVFIRCFESVPQQWAPI